MKFSTWLKDGPGRSSALAAHLGRSRTAISLWQKYGVPVRLMKQVHDYTGGAVTLEEMVLDSAASSKRPPVKPAKPAAIKASKPKQQRAAADAGDAQPERREASDDRRQCEGGYVAFVTGERREARRRASEKAQG